MKLFRAGQTITMGGKEQRQEMYIIIKLGGNPRHPASGAFVKSGVRNVHFIV